MNGAALERTLGADFLKLAPVIQRHHRLRSPSAETLDVMGRMQEVWHARWLNPLLPLLRVLDAVVPYVGHDVPAIVRCQADPNRPRVYWQREFRFADGRIGTFRSYKEFSGDHQVCEVIRGGIAARLKVSARADGGLRFVSEGFEWRMGRLRVPLPLRALIGEVRCEESALGVAEIGIAISFTHPWFGDLIRYIGRFEIPLNAD
jgi:hypothetical protein